MKLTISKLNKQLGIKIKPNHSSIGLDTATVTGVCIARTDSKSIDLQFITYDLRKIKDRLKRYDHMIDQFTTVITPDIKTVVIEESFLGRNVKTFQLLSRISAYAYEAAHNHAHIKDIRFYTPSNARRRIGLNTYKAKKEDIHKEFMAKTGLSLTNKDEIDALVLSLCGLIK